MLSFRRSKMKALPLLLLCCLLLWAPSSSEAAKKKKKNSKLFSEMEKAEKEKRKTGHMHLEDYPVNEKFLEHVEAGFQVGQVSELYFDYSTLNGYMTPSEAAERCEEDVQCGGFTYHG